MVRLPPASPDLRQILIKIGQGKQGKKKVEKKVEEEAVRLGPITAPGEEVFAVAHIYASFNDTFVVPFSVQPQRTSRSILR